MNMTDPIADMLTRIRNAQVARHDSVAVPTSRIKVEIARVLKDEGFIRDFELPSGEKEKDIKIHLRYSGRREPVVTGLKRISKPGLRVYTKAQGHPARPRRPGHRDRLDPAGRHDRGRGQRANVGGEVLCYVW